MTDAASHFVLKHGVTASAVEHAPGFEMEEVSVASAGLWPAGCQGSSRYGVGPPIFTETLHFQGLYQRGQMIAPVIVPGQIVDGGFPGVIRLIEAMWPKRRRVLISSLEEAPPGWELYTRIPPPLRLYEIPKVTP